MLLRFYLAGQGGFETIHSVKLDVLSVHEGVQPVVGTAGRDHGGDRGEVLLV